MRRQLLLRACQQQCKTAAYLLLICDFDYTLKSLDDGQIEQLASLFCHPTGEAIHFFKSLAASLRSDAIKQLALQKLKEWKEELEPVAAKLSPRPSVGELRPVFRDPVPASPPPRLHIVQPGDSLWRLSSKYNVPIEKLMEFNGISSTNLPLGKALKIPPH